MIAAIAGLLRGGADFFDAVQAAYDERRKGFAEREAGDFLDVEDLDLVRSSELQSPVPPGYPKLVRDAIDAYFEMFAEVTGVQLIEDSARVEGTRRAHTAGEVSAETPDAAPSPAGLEDSELLLAAAAVIEMDGADMLTELAVALRDRAAQFAALEATTGIPQEK
ncbi:hypothetical protein SEA_JAMIE19_38 [Mycobacterium phage Jamie19]|uniref:Uncharacterized protein n=4 Tax=Charlievirus TaxID=1623280 RepID=A0A142K835_9CAUD|nr:hypothetical protein BJD68_gp42 [Mycobacterium phage Phrann]YP_009304945.1 hypothetical protein BJD70_gp37 [Mycobacterium phage Panchino]YP_010052110.1 hypothetical protein KD931_gp38 [Mycobacterium phage Andies]YP_010052381.1 hypothetical protein KD935_gp38 [Mycobacterium phage Jamie19]QBI98077.1 hypothetical protein SEA_SPONGEBOB_38 [Mycobacterium phage SpongeBob]QNN98140.1 hypothetical protein SEA_SNEKMAGGEDON_38 [Mycobacterium phage Snekmaggedon]WAA19759.1 hypothetical protein SEA_SHWE